MGILTQTTMKSRRKHLLLTSKRRIKRSFWILKAKMNRQRLSPQSHKNMVYLGRTWQWVGLMNSTVEKLKIEMFRRKWRSMPILIPKRTNSQIKPEMRMNTIMLKLYRSHLTRTIQTNLTQLWSHSQINLKVNLVTTITLKSNRIKKQWMRNCLIRSKKSLRTKILHHYSLIWSRREAFQIAL